MAGVFDRTDTTEQEKVKREADKEYEAARRDAADEEIYSTLGLQRGFVDYFKIPGMINVLYDNENIDTIRKLREILKKYSDVKPTQAMNQVANSLNPATRFLMTNRSSLGNVKRTDPKTDVPVKHATDKSTLEQFGIEDGNTLFNHMSQIYKNISKVITQFNMTYEPYADDYIANNAEAQFQIKTINDYKDKFEGYRRLLNNLAYKNPKQYAEFLRSYIYNHKEMPLDNIDNIRNFRIWYLNKHNLDVMEANNGVY